MYCPFFTVELTTFLFYYWLHVDYMKFLTVTIFILKKKTRNDFTRDTENEKRLKL